MDAPERYRTRMSDLQTRLETIVSTAEQAAADASTLDELKRAEGRYVGRKSVLDEIMRSISTVPPEQRKSVGQETNAAKKRLHKLFAARRDALQSADVAAESARASHYDPTLPGPVRNQGTVHPVTRVQWEIEDLFGRLGFIVASGPELETEYYNFEALNTPADHPARDMQDTFWTTDDRVLRTQTSAVQVRMMEKFGPPLRIIAPGRCFRYETIDASHENTFFQLEGLVIDRNISIANLIATMKLLLREVFRGDPEVRLRPGYFPFVEPGFELDMSCMICGGGGCSTCKKTGWLEILPCGMVHPNVLRAGGIDAHEYVGFAFGLGLTRLAMMKYGIGDIRVLNGGDLRVLVPRERLTGPVIATR
jgi:phenylalanyl-tRNA synthetase alpha chain